MTKIRKTLCLLLAPLLLLSALAGCAPQTPEATATPGQPTATAAPTYPPDLTGDYTTQQWVAAEISFESTSEYAKPFYDVQLDVEFTAPDGTKMTMPAFWDGDNTWRVRFAPTQYGLWNFTTVCTDTANTGLNGKTGTLACNAYKGDLDIYKHGFVTTLPDTRYFVYADGTPFFYLGDTHWILPHEKFDTSNVEGIASQFKAIVDKRVTQRFTVYQSEPIQTKHSITDESTYALSNGFSKNDLAGFWNLDRKFKYVADAGLVHANAELFFSSEFVNFATKYPDDYLELLCRYWVARFGAYPVLWTTAQEVDKDFMGKFDADTNPWKKVLQFVVKYDPYKHPATAHQENALLTTASNSSFRDMPEHTWYAPQWKDYAKDKLEMYSFLVPQDYWNNGQGKPVVNYEANYEGFYTDRKGARAQGWIAYLNGMFGHGYGAAGIWNDIYAEGDYGTGYLIEGGGGEGSTANFDKYFKTWDQGLAMEGANDLGRMRTFFEQMEWWKLTPRFSDRTWSGIFSAWYALATIDSKVYVCYFYHSTTTTGQLLNMESGTYSAQWFNPSTGEYTAIGDITADETGKWKIPDKPDAEDWVLYVVKK